MSFLDTIKNALGTVGFGGSFTSEGTSVLGIDIGSASIKVVQLRREGGKAVLETYGAITLGPYVKTEAGRVTQLQEEQISAALTDLIREANVTGKVAAVAIPFAASLTSVVPMPRMSEDQLNKMIPIEARKYVPVPMNEVTLDWFVMPDDNAPERGSEMRRVTEVPTTTGANIPETLEVLLVAIHNSALDLFQRVMQKTSLQVQFYELEVFSAARSALGHGVAPVAVVDIGAATTKVYIVERGIVRSSHLINKGSQDLTLYLTRSLAMNFQKSERLKREVGLMGLQNTNDEEAKKISEAMLSTLDYIFNEVNRVLLGYGRQHHKNINRVVLCGGTSAMHGLREYAESKIETTVEVADSFSKIQAPAFLTEILKEVGPEFAVATGLALRELYGRN